MIKINQDSEIYSIVADIIATTIGAGASFLVGSFSNAAIDYDGKSTAKRGLMKAGKIGLETMTIYSVAPKMRKEIDGIVAGYNKFADMVNNYKEEDNGAD